MWSQLETRQYKETGIHNPKLDLHHLMISPLHLVFECKSHLSHAHKYNSADSAKYLHFKENSRKNKDHFIFQGGFCLTRVSPTNKSIASKCLLPLLLHHESSLSIWYQATSLWVSLSMLIRVHIQTTQQWAGSTKDPLCPPSGVLRRQRQHRWAVPHPPNHKE